MLCNAFAPKGVGYRVYSTHVSIFQLLLHSQHVSFELSTCLELLTSGVERLASILEDVLDSSIGVFV